MDDKINSTSELYMKVLPALRSKKKELNIKKLSFISEKDIWDYLVRNKWRGEKSLTLYDIVSDILNTPDDCLIDYMSKG